MALVRTAKSCGPDAPMPGVKSAIRSAGDGVKQAWSPGRARSKPQNHCAGNAGSFRCDRGDYARVLFSFAREAAGASRARHSLRPLNFRRRDVLQTSRGSRGEIAKSCLYIAGCLKCEVGKLAPPSLRANGSRECAPDDRLREAIHSAACGEMDCFRLRSLSYGGQVVAVAPRNDGLPGGANLPGLVGCFFPLPVRTGREFYWHL